MILAFDYDGTLVEDWTAKPLPGVREALGCIPSSKKTAIITNQSGPVWRGVTGLRKYPSVDDIAQRLARGLLALEWWPTHILIATHTGRTEKTYRDGAALVTVLLRETLHDLGLTQTVTSDHPDWRKPGPAMLEAFAHWYRVSAHDVLHVGDMEADEQAARAAGTRFQWAKEWREQQIAHEPRM